MWRPQIVRLFDELSVNGTMPKIQGVCGAFDRAAAGPHQAGFGLGRIEGAFAPRCYGAKTGRPLRALRLVRHRCSP
jgi:hypothetical protein